MLQILRGKHYIHVAEKLFEISPETYEKKSRKEIV